MATSEPSTKMAFGEDGLDSKWEDVSGALLPNALNWAMTHGLIYADMDPQGDNSRATHCPLSILPLKVPAHAFQTVASLGPLWNRLVDAVARDTTWLYETLEAAGRVDPFTGRLMDICRAVHDKAGGQPRQPIYLGIHRSDYMLHEPAGTPAGEARFLQVELNTIASSFGALSSITGDLHRYVLGRHLGGEGSVARTLREHFGAADAAGVTAAMEKLPSNWTLQSIPDAMAAAHDAYVSALSDSERRATNESAVVVFVVQPGERNFADQRHLEYALWANHRRGVVRKTLREIHDECSVKSSGQLRLGDGTEVSVVYFRSGYAPTDYPTEMEWAARTMLEHSLAVKCPSVAYQLVGTKKVQQALARPGAVERFMDAESSAKLRGCFTGLWGLGPGEDDAEIVSRVRAEPRNFVMKPQREGGGNNVYGDSIIPKLDEMSEDERSAYIMMQRIEPRPQLTPLTKRGVSIWAPALSEFGFYSVFVGDGRQVCMDAHAGHLVRTKAEGVDEGGVASGYAVLNSPFLVD
eukprot:TRINITY_DN69687_c0_g1_i1.p1 TRINITY_DN69687_c0_g1~~TRINITY_DN69687_c0_g1_i1.p1  ORF type:complete len:537 (+),score=70.84 TRINITY_DN69687_c0_g1_i1:44-1612(+)